MCFLLLPWPYALPSRSTVTPRAFANASLPYRQDRFLPRLSAHPRFAVGIGKQIALSRLHERLGQQRGLYEVHIPLGATEGIRAPPGCNDQLVDGIPLGSGDIHANAFPVQQYLSLIHI